MINSNIALVFLLNIVAVEIGSLPPFQNTHYKYSQSNYSLIPSKYPECMGSECIAIPYFCYMTTTLAACLALPAMLRCSIAFVYYKLSYMYMFNSTDNKRCTTKQELSLSFRMLRRLTVCREEE